VFLCDSGKFDTESLYELTTLDEIDACVFDKPFPELRAKCQILV
jgi:DeoR/GlpR family transcriptional regulator of sugar metabolism